ncbi:D-methionine transport system substrate-binding protein [Halobacillus karajensis]|uniref:Lipoprotein n=1 Tax=Halobacillus karajensis TaxID=195088 RepID=A0A024P2L0_9BACI|nr:MetQ/NlpA family ABC transporter substrate-binding protein [Halobacillus karajensis]CDQ19328.1 Methionine-binding lipoprotein MetQ precursor [Halobacillus karajensis]CDQ22509.1 Methionine-binding lipoprotein MetQ precursor [Halobacillus karajensis]CDQ25991.1 Methionine-binding lipoprotein MetQ precursor [Halobacillus karajensis]SEH38260.1 D-methionine transport system substrate-binding protein [Halobacillus karajensis]
MKKIWTGALALLFVLVLAACGSSEDDASGSEEGGSEESSEIKVGATSVPHAEVLEEAKPLLEEEGITLKIEEYQDYILPNKDLSEGRIDANYFQTIPYLEVQEKENGYDFANLGGIHIEPIGVYSQKYDDIDDIEEGTTLVMSRSVSTHGRVLSILEKEGLIKLDESVEKVEATVDDIVENPKNIEFDTGVDAAGLPEVYKREENVLVAINTNYAIEAGLVPKEDAIILEGTNSPYVNVVAAQSKDKDNEALNKLVEVLRSEEIQNFIKEEYDGAVVPVSADSE